MAQPCRVALAAPSHGVQRILDAAGMTEVLAVYDLEADAGQACGRRPTGKPNTRSGRCFLSTPTTMESGTGLWSAPHLWPRKEHHATPASKVRATSVRRWLGVAGVVAQHGFLIVRYPRTPTAFGRASTGAATIPAMGDGLLGLS
jgi:hypothetical protein